MGHMWHIILRTYIGLATGNSHHLILGVILKSNQLFVSEKDKEANNFNS